MTDDIESRMFAEAEQFLGEATDAATTDRIELRDAVCAYFIAQRANGVNIEVIIDAVEAILKNAEQSAGVKNDSAALARRLVDWCVASNPPTRPTIV